jgi:hypothetical protein
LSGENRHYKNRLAGGQVAICLLKNKNRPTFLFLLLFVCFFTCDGFDGKVTGFILLPRWIVYSIVVAADRPSATKFVREKVTQSIFCQN